MFADRTDATKSDVLSYLDMHVELCRQIEAPPGSWLMESFVSRNGHDYAARMLPSRYARGMPNACFQNSAALVNQHPSLRYCEGFLTMGKIPFAIHHAWALDRKGRVVDVTLADPTAYEYRGVTFKLPEYYANLREHGVCSMLHTGTIVNFELMLTRDPDLKTLLPPSLSAS